MDMASLPNIGETLAAELARVGVDTPDALREIGSVRAAARIATGGRDACYNLLFALEGAIRGVRWHSIPKDERERLKLEFDALRGGG